jgi:uncharacterized protein YbaR (Trm112 family)
MTDVKSAISQELLEILVCPIDKQPVRLQGNELVCVACGHRYRIENGVPNMLVDQD